MKKQELNLEDLDRISIIDSRNYIVAKLGLVATFYIQDSANPIKRQAIAQCIADYLLIASNKIHWFLQPSGSKWCSLEKTKLPNISDQLIALPETDDFDFAMHSGQSGNEAGHYSLRVFSPSGMRPNKLGFISFYLPFSWVKRHNGAFQKKIINWSNVLTPFHGYAGLAVIRNPNYANARSAEPFIFPLIQRFSGLEFDEPVDHAQMCKNGIKSINWLTILNYQLLEKIGGIEKAKGVLKKEGIKIDEYADGVVIQAGVVPQFGDTSKDFILKSYQTVAHFLKPIRAPYEDSLIQTPEGIDEYLFAQQWLGRFE